MRQVTFTYRPKRLRQVNNVMKGVLIVGITILSILVVGIGSILYLNKTATGLALLLEETLTAVQEEDWGRAEEMVSRSLERWETVQQMWSAMINHKEVDNIKTTLERAKEYVANQEKASAIVELAVAKLLVEHVPQKEKPSWSNIL